MLARPAIRLRRWLVAIAAVLLLTVGSTVALLRIRFEGPDLAATLATMLNRKMRGHIAVRSVEWPMSSLKTVVTGGWVPLTLHDIEVKDSDGQVVLTSPKITAEIDIHSLMFGNHDFVFRRIVVHGGDVLLREIPEPYPLHAYDKKVFSLLAAFYAKRGPASFYEGIASTGTAPLFDLRDFSIRDVDVEVLIKAEPEQGSYKFRARVEDVSADGFLYMDPTDPLLPKFYFALAPTGGPGEIDLFWEQAKDGSGWRGAYRFPLDALRVERLSQLPASWPESPIADTLRFQLAIDLSSKAKATVTGRMIEYLTNTYGGYWDVTADVTNAGPMLKESFLPELGGDDVTIKTAITGPIVFFPRIDLAISGLTYDLDLLGRDLHLELETLNATYDLAINTGQVREFIGRGAGGELKLSATFEGDGSNDAPFVVDALIAIDEPLLLTDWMTPCLRNLIGDRLQGKLRARRYKGDPALVAQVDDFVLDFGKLKLSAPASPVGKQVGIMADQYESRLDLADVRAQLGSARTLIDGYYYWKTNKRNIRFRAQAAGVNNLATSAQRCISELTASPAPRPRAQPRRGAQGPRRPTTHYLRPTRAAAGASSSSSTIAPPRVHAQQAPTQPSSPRRARRCTGFNLADTDTVWSSDGADDSRFAGTAELTCLPIIDTLRAKYVYDGTRATIESATSSSLGGVIRASGVVRINPAIAIERLRIVADNVELARVEALDKLLTGKIAADVTVRGPPDPRHMTGEGWACSNKVTVLGDVYTDVGVWLSRAPGTLAKCKGALPPDGANDACLAVGKAGGRCIIARARRDAGGELAVRIHADRNQKLGGAIGITGVPLAAIAALAGTTIPAGATLDAAGLALGGTVDAPTLSGTVRVTRAWLLGSFVGDGDLTVRESGPGAIGITGTFLDGRLALRGRIGTAAPYPADLTLEATRIAVDSLVDLTRLTGLSAARASVSGRVRVRTALGDDRALLDVAIDLSELTTTVAVPGFGALPTAIDVKLASPVTATYDGTTIALTAPAAFETPFGTVAVSGRLSPAAVELQAKGALDLGRARPLAGTVLDEIRGNAELTATVTGRLADPRITATIDLDDAVVRLARQDSLLRVPEGRIALDDGEISFTGLRLEVTDGYTDAAQAALRVSGGIVLEDWRPALWNVLVEGDLAGEMLVALAPEEVASGTGVADITVTLKGEGLLPPVDAVIVFDPARPLTVLLRSVRREVALSEGTVTITDQQIELDEVNGTIDGEGRLRGIRGTLDPIDWAVVGADVTASADAVPYRVPRTLDLVLNIDRLNAVLDRGGDLEVSGNVEVVSGRYLRDFNVGEAFKLSSSSGPSAPPFWDSVPMIRDAKLELRLEARRFSVVDNIANIDMFGTLLLTGTPRDPRIDGTITVQRGQFKIPGLRPRFSRTTGTVVFSPLLPPGQTPTLDITSEADYRDPSGQDHLITLVVKGSLGSPDWDLYTATGLNKGQTLTLIVSGRTPEEFRRNLGQGAIGSDPTRITATTDDSQGYTDEMFRQVAGDLLSSKVSDSLRDLSGLDVARIEFNLASFGFHGEKRVFENAQLVGDLERTGRGSSVNARAELRLPSAWTAELSWLVKNFDDATEKDINDLEIKLVKRSFWRELFK